eukprot:6515479-Prymnesium_polylepis.1
MAGDPAHRRQAAGLQLHAAHRRRGGAQEPRGRAAQRQGGHRRQGALAAAARLRVLQDDGCRVLQATGARAPRRSLAPN